MVVELFVAGSLAIGAAQAAAQGPRPCPVAQDAEYGLTIGKPIRIGGGAASMVARERRYLDALRGPAGEVITYTRLGSGGPPGQRPLDYYSLTYPGLASSVTIYLDAYRFDDAPKAPKGFTCIGFSHGAPPVDAFTAMDALVRLAIEQGPTKDIPAISLDADGSAQHGVALDRFRAIAIHVREAAKSGTAISPSSPPGDLPGAGLRIFAYPIRCGERVVAPVNIDLVPPQGPMIRRVGELLTGDGVATLVPGFKAPAGSIAALFTLGVLRQGDTVRISYADVLCDGVSKERALVARATPAKPLSLPQPSLPSDAPAGATPLWVQAIVDVDGAFQQVSYIGGPEALLSAGLEAIKGWRAEPARVNGTPVIFDTLLVVQFK